MKNCLVAFGMSALLLPGAAMAEDFEISFEWGDIPLCTSGNPNTVDNPRLELRNVPEGTGYIEFKMVDRDVPGYNHGGGGVEYTGQSVIEPGAFTYRSPCPPNGSHTYEWTADANEDDGFFADTYGTAKASRDYPE